MLQEVADAFIAARLLTTNEIAGTTTIEVSHEALIREWPRLAGWLREARDDIPLQQAISQDAAQWEQHNKPRDRLYRGSQLKEAEAWVRRNTPSGNEVAFLRASAVYRVRSLVNLIAVLLIVVSLMGVTSYILTHQSPKPPDPTRVSNLQDNEKPGSLRYALEEAPPRSTITFDMSLRGTILLSSGDLNIAKDLTIRGPGNGTLSISSGKGGHIVRVVRGVTVTISGLTFKNSNTSNGFIDNEGKLTLSNSTVSGNMATELFNSGGGIYNGDNGTLTLSNSTVSGNTSQYDGGGIDNFGTLKLNNNTFSGNTAQFGDGGGIENYGTLTVNDSTFSSNTANCGNCGGIPGGGGIYNAGTLTVSDSTISSNTAKSGNGGGIAVSDNGSGVTLPVQVMLLYCTVYDNTANVGGGIWIDTLDKESQVNIGASIVAGNSAHTRPDIVGPLTTLGYNLVGERSSATILGSPKMQSTDVFGVPSTTLGIEPLVRDNGGLTTPHTFTHALLPGSPAIDKIPLAACHPNGITTDQRGMKRPDDNESACDIGAYEYVDSST